jgi:S1-C subfamily serine protease
MKYKFLVRTSTLVGSPIILAILLTHLNVSALHASFFSGEITPSTIHAIPKSEQVRDIQQIAFSESPLLAKKNSVPVPIVAKQVTVRILTNSESGSGVIIKRVGQTYTVLTCDHVVANSQDNDYTVLTADGRTYAAQWLRSIRFQDTDLAVVQFTSDQSYRVVEMGDSNALSVGAPVYASGFPNWQFINPNAVEDTREWGLRAFRLTTGRVEMLPRRSLLRGYQIGYTNEVEQGMSGGPVLNSNGQLVGINGRLKYPLQGIGAYTLADGTLPSETLFQQMESLSWAIPINKYGAL